MKIYLLRHGDAEDGVNITDFERQLTAKGVSRTQTAARVIAALGVAPAHIFSSPRIRAKQTAEIVAGALGKQIEIREDLDFNFSVDAVAKLTADLNNEQDAIFVGHEPGMSTTVAALTGAIVEMKKGGLARIDLTQRQPTLQGVLSWLIAPAVFDVLNAKT
jgi:phosphohistidine phosphatase